MGTFLISLDTGRVSKWTRKGGQRILRSIHSNPGTSNTDED